MKIQFTNCERNYWRILNIIIIFQCLRENKQANKEMACNKALKVSNVIKFSYSCFLEKKKCFFVFILINNKKRISDGIFLIFCTENRSKPLLYTFFITQPCQPLNYTGSTLPLHAWVWYVESQKHVLFFSIQCFSS